MTEIVDHTVTHSTFVLEHTYPVSPERVFAAWASKQAKTPWFVALPEGASVVEPLDLDFRVGGKERLAVSMADGVEIVYEGCYQDIVSDRRIVATTQMYLNRKPMSVTVATIELTPIEDGTRLVLTEQGAYLDGLDEPKYREAGTRDQLASLARYLKKSS
ncbi:SRPBCC family protein [Catenulispora yoronensis]|uniref:SRPBCC family protein n=1 Tax=Catenulispora yoronensis TaxID=450799 RepID=A0ABN2UMV1_9ACTN